ncbi:hypothetical protein DXJ84_11170 [Vibrio parahaemolyticus]|nr:hypothetical protein DXJ84_11170 [Vibrio parahaemolyticus]
MNYHKNVMLSLITYCRGLLTFVYMHLNSMSSAQDHFQHGIKPEAAQLVLDYNYIIFDDAKATSVCK